MTVLMSQSSVLVRCARCGAVGGEDPPLDWALSSDHGRVELYCATCVRDTVRAVEARLDPADW
jgi:hypothetical protein